MTLERGEEELNILTTEKAIYINTLEIQLFFDQ